MKRQPFPALAGSAFIADPYADLYADTPSTIGAREINERIDGLIVMVQACRGRGAYFDRFADAHAKLLEEARAAFLRHALAA